MRMLLKVRMPHAEFNDALRDGSAGQTLGCILDDIKPEAVYFTELNGQRGAIMIDPVVGAHAVRMCAVHTDEVRDLGAEGCGAAVMAADQPAVEEDRRPIIRALEAEEDALPGRLIHRLPVARPSRRDGERFWQADSSHQGGRRRLGEQLSHAIPGGHPGPLRRTARGGRDDGPRRRLPCGTRDGILGEHGGCRTELADAARIPLRDVRRKARETRRPVAQGCRDGADLPLAGSGAWRDEAEAVGAQPAPR